MARCPNCNHNPTTFSSSWMWLKKCGKCGKVFCHGCGKYGRNCPKCGSQDVDEHHEKCHGD